MTLKAVAQFENPALASLLVTTLEKVGFHPAPVAESQHVQLAGVDRVFTVEVPADERKAVVEFLESNGYGSHVIKD